jgi:hypothetical protein
MLDLLHRHVLALIASHELMGGQLHALRVQIDQARQDQRPTAVEAPLPARCQAEGPEHCGRQNPDAISQRPGWAPMCKGCGFAPTAE